MRKSRKIKIVALLLAFITAVTIIPTTEAQAAAKLTKDDFTYSAGGSTTNIIDPNQYFNLDNFCCLFYYRDNSFTTNRGIVIGDSLSKVEEAYGKAKANKIVKNDSVYTTMQENCMGYNIEAWKYYLEYKYTTADKHKLCIRFYFNKKDKLDAVVYKPADYKGLYCSKFFKSGIKFVAPKGKKITTKTIDGKKVYMVPLNSTFSFKKNNKNYVVAEALVCNNPTNDIGMHVWLDDSYESYKKLKYNKSYSVKSLFNKVYNSETGEKVSYKKLGDYKYLVLKLKADPDEYNGDHRKVPVPEYIYFKIVD